MNVIYCFAKLNYFLILRMRDLGFILKIGKRYLKAIRITMVLFYPVHPEIPTKE